MNEGKNSSYHNTIWAQDLEIKSTYIMKVCVMELTDLMTTEDKYRQIGN